jgi:hypothetical protein
MSWNRKRSSPYTARKPALVEVDYNGSAFPFCSSGGFIAAWLPIGFYMFSEALGLSIQPLQTSSVMETPARDPQLWRMAKQRAKFKSHLFTYVAINALLWAIWALTDRNTTGIPWPIWSTVFWGIGVFLNGVGVYGGFDRSRLSEREYEKLMRQRTDRL